MLLDGSIVNPLIAFMAGFVSFLAPCVLAILPVQALILADRRKRPIYLALAFILGFILVFMLLGVGANTLGKTLTPYRDLVQEVGGVFLIFLGLTVLSVWRLPIFYRELRLRIEERVKGASSASAFLLGITFGFSWSPCIGPVLAVILFWASSMETALKGSILLLFYGLGLAVPFLLLSLFSEAMMKLVLKVRPVARYVQIFLGLVIILTGVLLATGGLGYLIGLTLRLQSF